MTPKSGNFGEQNYNPQDGASLAPFHPPLITAVRCVGGVPIGTCQNSIWDGIYVLPSSIIIRLHKSWLEKDTGPICWEVRVDHIRFVVEGNISSPRHCSKLRDTGIFDALDSESNVVSFPMCSSSAL